MTAINIMNLTIVIFFAIFYLIGTSISIVPVFGHASPITYNPKPNQIINSKQLLPNDVTITFTESPEPRASNLKVMGPNNERIDNNDLKVLESSKSLSISLDKPKVIPGIYTVNWLVLSKADGHITKGSYAFTLAESGQNQNQNRQPATNASSEYSKNITADNVILNFDISPFKVGQNTFNIQVSYVNGTAVENIRDVFLEFNNPAKNLGPIVDVMDKIEPGKYTSTGSFLSQEGDWEIKTTAQRIGEYDINQLINVNVT
ncbi:MAG: copper resistance protein CopC [Thermoproteota archaeon]|nr:copper resistance protein CopC [Thermoproteota archaeon]